MSTKSADALRGAVASLVASTAMGGVILTAAKLGLMGRESPPRRITRKLLDRSPLAKQQLDGLTTAAHLGYGAVAGAGFGLLANRLPNVPARVAAGLAYGAAVYASSYAGWLPAVNLMPPVRKDKRSRQVSMVLAHLLYGGVLGALLPGRSAASPLADEPKESRELDEALEDSFPASDPPSMTQPARSP